MMTFDRSNDLNGVSVLSFDMRSKILLFNAILNMYGFFSIGIKSFFWIQHWVSRYSSYIAKGLTYISKNLQMFISLITCNMALNECDKKLYMGAKPYIA